MTEQLVEMMKEVLAQDELYDLGAKMIKKSFDALVKNGFTREEALNIVSVQGNFVKAK